MKIENQKNTHGVYEYRQEDITFVNRKDRITFSGTLALPQSPTPLPAVVLVAGTGKHERNLTFPGGKHLFLDLSDYLAQRGIIVLRYDKRGGGTSGGVFNLSDTSEDFARDAHAALEYMRTRKEVDHAKLGLIGHSEGGLISCMLAAQRSAEFPLPDFIITLAAGVINNVDDIIEQTKRGLKADGASDHFIEHDATMRKALFDVIAHNTSNIALPLAQEIVQKYLASLTPSEKAESVTLPFALTEMNYQKDIELFDSPWFRYFIFKQPALNSLPKITIPMLALNGDKDWIVASQWALPIIKKQCASPDLTIIEIPNHNHWFQQCVTGSMEEYNTIAGTISDRTLQIIMNWLTEHVVSK